MNPVAPILRSLRRGSYGPSMPTPWWKNKQIEQPLTLGERVQNALTVVLIVFFLALPIIAIYTIGVLHTLF